jgi:hypothetical protein
MVAWATAAAVSPVPSETTKIGVLEACDGSPMARERRRADVT